MSLESWRPRASKPTLSLTTSDSVRPSFPSTLVIILTQLGLAGGSCVVTIFKRPSFFKAGGADGRTRMGYNHGAECRPVTQADVDKVKSVKANSKYAEVSL